MSMLLLNRSNVGYRFEESIYYLRKELRTE